MPSQGAETRISLRWHPTEQAQNRQTDSQTLQQILGELKAIHEDMRATESTQILIADWKCNKALSTAQPKISIRLAKNSPDGHSDLKTVGTDLAMAQNHLDQTSNPDERKHCADDIDRLKGNMSALKEDEQRRAVTQQDMQQRLKAAEDRLDDIEHQLNAVVVRFGSVRR